jgi:hypothetical protein
MSKLVRGITNETPESASMPAAQENAAAWTPTPNITN